MIHLTLSNKSYIYIFFCYYFTKSKEHEIKKKIEDHLKILTKKKKTQTMFIQKQKYYMHEFLSSLKME